MNLGDLIKTTSTGDVLLIAFLLLSLIQITPIKINPWSFIAKHFGNVVQDLPSGLFSATPTVVLASGKILTCVNTEIGFTAANSASSIQTYLINRNASAVTQASAVHWVVRGKWK